MENPPPNSPKPQAPSSTPQAPGYPPGEQQPGYPQAPPPDFQQAAPGYPQQHAGGYPQHPAGGYPQQPAKGYPQQKGYAPVPTGFPPGQYVRGYVVQPGLSHMSSANTTVVVAQPGVVQAAVLPYFNDYMGTSIFSCLCCCWCIGSFAIMKSSEARNRYIVGDYTGALASANTARSLSIAAIGSGICMLAIVVMIEILAISSAHHID